MCGERRVVEGVWQEACGEKSGARGVWREVIEEGRAACSSIICPGFS